MNGLVGHQHYNSFLGFLGHPSKYEPHLFNIGVLARTSRTIPNRLIFLDNNSNNNIFNIYINKKLLSNTCLVFIMLWQIKSSFQAKC